MIEVSYRVSENGGLFHFEIDNLADVKDGFWVNGHMEFTRGSDCTFYIMPHRINYIKKI